MVKKESTKKQQTIEAKPNLGRNHTINFLILKNQGFPPLSDRPLLKRKEWAIAVMWISHRRELLPKKRRIGSTITD